MLRAVHDTHTGREITRERKRERKERKREREERTRAAATAASAAWWCGDQGGCTRCLDDHRVMSLEAWRPSATADDDPEAAFPVGDLCWWPLAAPLRPNSRREFASSSCVARSSAWSWPRAPYTLYTSLHHVVCPRDDKEIYSRSKFRSTFGGASLFLFYSPHSAVRHVRVRRADSREYASQISRSKGTRRSGTYTRTRYT